MTPVNFNQLYYFYQVAREGSIARVSELLHITPQTVSGQLSSLEHSIGSALFIRQGKKWQLTEIGRMTYRYAEDIFQLGDELKKILKNHQLHEWETFTVGITDVLPKAFIYEMLKPVMQNQGQLRLICREGEQGQLLAELALNKIDLVLSDQPIQPGSHLKAYSHLLAESGTSFFASHTLIPSLAGNFPQNLHQAPMLIQSRRSTVRQHLMAWFEQQSIHPTIVAEFDDSALMKAFGQQGTGFFAAPSQIEQKICEQYQVQVIGRTPHVKEAFYAISAERKITHPAVLTLVQALAALR
jgi:LysR family transcriptional activator of nhaA